MYSRDPAGRAEAQATLDYELQKLSYWDEQQRKVADELSGLSGGGVKKALPKPPKPRTLLSSFSPPHSLTHSAESWAPTGNTNASPAGL